MRQLPEAEAGLGDRAHVHTMRHKTIRVSQVPGRSHRRLSGYGERNVQVPVGAVGLPIGGGAWVVDCTQVKNSALTWGRHQLLGQRQGNRLLDDAVSCVPERRQLLRLRNPRRQVELRELPMPPCAQRRLSMRLARTRGRMRTTVSPGFAAGRRRCARK